MKYTVEALREIASLSIAESHRYSDAVSALRNLASDGAISWDDVERVEDASKPYVSKANAVHAAAMHALEIALNQPRPPFIPAPAPLTAKEEMILDRAVNDYYNA